MTLEPTDGSAAPAQDQTPVDNSATSGAASGNVDLGGGNELMTQKEWDNLPKAWKKDYEADWKGLPEKVRQYVYSREGDVERGIRQYADGHGRWAKTIEPFQDIFSKHADVDPVALFQGLAQNHLALTQAEPAQRKAMFQQIAKHYGVDFAEAAAGDAGANAAQGGLTPEAVRAMVQEMVAPIAQQAKTASTFLETQHSKEVQSKVDAFWSDPENEFINEVADGVVQIIKSGQTRDLKEAYELAVMRNPAVKGKYLQRLTEKAANPTPDAGPRNVKNSSAPASPGKPKTMDDTINGIIAKHYK